MLPWFNMAHLPLRVHTLFAERGAKHIRVICVQSPRNPLSLGDARPEINCFRVYTEGFPVEMAGDKT